MKPRKIAILLVATTLIVLLLAQAVAADQPMSDGSEQETTAQTSHRLIVQLASPSLVELSTSVSAQGASDLVIDGRLNTQSPTAQAHVQQLQIEQRVFVNAIQAAVPQASAAAYIDSAGVPQQLAYQVVMNAVVLELPKVTPDAVRSLTSMAGVRQVFRDYQQKPHMYASLPLINAPAIWEALGGQGMSGEGIIVGSIDTGVYAPNAFFDPTGFEYPEGYPVGDTSVTTAKVIGARAYFRPWDPPLPIDDGALPGPNSSSHGTHTAGTAAGNADTTATVAGYTETISGVAPKAQILSYRIGYPTDSEFSGSAFDAEIVQAYEDAVTDGADVINYSFGGYDGVMPWASATTTAREAAWDAGVFVSHSAGNSGRDGFSTTGDASQKVIEVAASTTTGTIASGVFSVTAPEPVPDELKDISFATPSFGAPLPIGEILGPYPYLSAIAVDEANFEGCDAWPEGTFDGVGALISRGACEFGVKVLNAEQAGAQFVVVYNHASGGEGLVSMGPGAVGNQVTISSIFVGHTDGLNLVDWYDTNGDASQFGLDTTGFQAGNVPDVIADFSSRGPAYANWLEPDVTAPGVNILSAGYGLGVGLEQLEGFGQASGTSMAAPHVAGSAALLKQMHPDWTPTQIMSALMSTSTTEVWLDADHTIPAGVLDMGAGRIDLAKAGDPGLTFDYPSLSFGSVTAGEPVTLTITATDVSGAGGTYDLSAMADGSVSVTVDPVNLTFAAGESKSFTVVANATDAEIGDHGGMVYLTSDSHMAHLPLWVRTEANSDAKVMLIDNDMSDLLGYPDYTTYYTSTLERLGWEFDYYNADLRFDNPRTLPTAADLTDYEVIIYWSGDNYQSDGTFTVATPLTQEDLRVLSDWQFNGGRLLASGQDLASAWDALDSNFFYDANLGAEYLHDSIFDPFFDGVLPPVPSVVGQPGSPFSGLVVDLSGYGDGAANQYFVDEIAHAPFGDLGAPETVKPVMASINGTTLEAGTVAVARAAYPTLEEPVPPYDYRSLYLSFGFEGINNDTGYHTREDVMAGAMAWMLDSNEVTVHSGLQDVDSIGTSYRWDFGDDMPYTAPNGSNQAVHQYDAAGVYTVRVEALNGWGATQLGSMEVEISEETVGQTTYLTAEMSSNYEAPEPMPNPVSIVVPLLADAWIDSSAPATNYDGYASLATWTSGVDNILLTFDPTVIPADVEILDAVLTMNAINTSGSLGKSLTVLNVEAFDSTAVTFATAPNAFNPSGSVPFTDLGTVSFDVINQVSAWEGGAAQLAVASEGTFGRVSFDSLESYEAAPAMITVIYQP
ncbi:MAG: S8 family serine peptidase [Chloroflexi bacterium]|nr:S8 family serine peptidase [Chloroflexota bacterium]